MRLTPVIAVPDTPHPAARFRYLPGGWSQQHGRLSLAAYPSATRDAGKYTRNHPEQRNPFRSATLAGRSFTCVE
jgi:hypothetical protein